MTKAKVLFASISIVVLFISILAIAYFSHEDSNRQDRSEAAIIAPAKSHNQITSTGALERLRLMESAKREDRLRMQLELYDKWKSSARWQRLLRDVATKQVNGITEYQRYIASAMVAGFGRPSRIGPNSLKDNQLGWYIKLQAGGIRAPDKRRIVLDRSLENLSVTVPPNERDDLTFQEILLQIIQKYKLEFRITDEHIFLITEDEDQVQEIVNESISHLNSEDGIIRSEAMRTLFKLAGAGPHLEKIKEALSPRLTKLLRKSFDGENELKTYHLIMVIESFEIDESMPELLAHLDFRVERFDGRPGMGTVNIFPAAIAIAKRGEKYVPQLLSIASGGRGENARIARRTVANILLYTRRFKGALEWVRIRRKSKDLTPEEERVLSDIEDYIESKR